MKKIIPIVLVLALALALMLVPVFASNFYSAFADDAGDVYFGRDNRPVPGIYTLTFDVDLELNGSFDTYTVYNVNFALDSFGFLAGSFFLDVGQVEDCQISIEGVNNEVFFLLLHQAPNSRYRPLESIEMTLVSPAPDQPEAPNTGEPVEAVLGVFSGVGSWIISSLAQYTGLFYSAESGLTLLGVLCCVPIAIGICFVILLLVINFFKLRN